LDEHAAGGVFVEIDGRAHAVAQQGAGHGGSDGVEAFTDSAGDDEIARREGSRVCGSAENGEACKCSQTTGVTMERRRDVHFLSSLKAASSDRLLPHSPHPAAEMSLDPRDPATPRSYGQNILTRLAENPLQNRATKLRNCAQSLGGFTWGNA
jgi:hypothetical protein